jgi:hypothetical protein
MFLAGQAVASVAHGAAERTVRIGIALSLVETGRFLTHRDGREHRP